MHSTKAKEYENDWALKVDESMIHITLAESGKKGYFCLGCGEEMQAVKPFRNIHPYFRHDATNVKRDKAKCVLASRTYREKIAKDFFFRTKEIKTPRIDKYPPNGENGQAVLLSEVSTIVASSIKSELTFYETEDGTIKWGSNPGLEDRYNLIRPDLTFFNEEGEPLLLLEIVVTHKVDNIKKEKLRRLGLDCLQVIIPKKGTIEIENYLQKSSNFKWIYNELEASTQYISIFNGDSEEISPIDEQQRKLLEESYNCRKSQLGQLVRSITRSLRSESYRGVEKNFRSEISRIETATINLRRRYAEQERALEREVGESINGEIIRIREEQERITSEQESENSKYSELEERYLRKRSQLEWEQSDVDQEQVNYEAAIDQERDYIAEHLTEREVRADIERKEREIEDEFKHLEEEEKRTIGALRKDIIQPRSGAITRIRGGIETGKRRIQDYSNRRTRLLEEEKKMGEDQKEYPDTSKSRIERSRKQILERINKEDISGNDELSERIRAVLEIRRICRDFEDRRKLEQELKNS